MAPKGSIKKRVDDANFNIAHGKHEAALALLLIAVDGSSKKVYPEGTMSLVKPKEKMGNKERYTKFLGVRIRQILGIALDDRAYQQPNLIKFIEGIESPEDKIYTSFRCNDLHESGLPDDLRYVYEPEGVSNAIQIEFGNEGVRFSSGFLSLLENVIKGATCNGDEFGLSYYRFITVDNEEMGSLFDRLSLRYNISTGRLGILKELIELAGPDALSLKDEELAQCLTKILDTKMPGGARTGLCTAGSPQPVCIRDGNITGYGVGIVRDMLACGKLVSYDDVPKDG
ncbi:hypothetical protein ACM91Y_002217 [Cronobacter dublinensis]